MLSKKPCTKTRGRIHRKNVTEVIIFAYVSIVSIIDIDTGLLHPPRPERLLLNEPAEESFICAKVPFHLLPRAYFGEKPSGWESRTGRTH